MYFIKNYFKLALIFLSVFVFSYTSASITEGTISDTNNKAIICKDNLCSIYSTINFKTTNGQGVSITDDGLSGDIWSADYGWISLTPAKGGVKNTKDGNLSGYAWGENIGWVNFSPAKGGVSINESGEFVGYAWGENIGWIKFDCTSSSSCVSTDWRPDSVRPKDKIGAYMVSTVVNPTIIPTKPVVPTLPPVNENPKNTPPADHNPSLDSSEEGSSHSSSNDSSSRESDTKEGDREHNKYSQDEKVKDENPQDSSDSVPKRVVKQINKISELLRDNTASLITSAFEITVEFYQKVFNFFMGLLF